MIHFHFLLQSLAQMFLALTLHECGHLLAALALRRPISSMTIGCGPRLCTLQVRQVWLRLHLLPFTGNIVVVYPSRSPWKDIIVYAAGPAANLLTAAACWPFYPDFAIFSLLLGALNLAALHNKSSDGANILRLARK